MSRFLLRLLPALASLTALGLAASGQSCLPPETLAAAVTGVFGPGTSVSALTKDDLVGVSDADLERLFLAAGAPDLVDLLGLEVAQFSLVPGPTYDTPAGTKAWRPEALTPDESAAGMWFAAPIGDTPFKAYRVTSLFDGCPVLRLSYLLNPNDAATRRRKDEVRRINDVLSLGIGLTEAEVDGEGLPLGGPAALQRFFALDLSAPGAWTDVPALGWPWSGSAPVGGAPPPGWTPSFPVDATIYPFADKVLALRHGDMHYFDEGPADPADAVGTVLLVHGNPTWSFYYRDVAAELIAQGYRVVAPDHFGLGLSSKPSLSAFGHKPHEHADALENFVQALDLNELLMVVTDWGTPTGLTMAAHMPSRVERILILNGWAWNLDAFDPGPFHRLVDWSIFNLVSSGTLIASGSVPRGIGETIAALHGAPGSPAFLAVRDAYWGAFLDQTTGLPLSPAAVFPTNQLAIELLADRDFLEEAERGLATLASKPVGFHIGSLDSLMGALRCDQAPATPCPPGLVCTTVGNIDYCLTPGGAFSYPCIERFLSHWDPDAVATVTIEANAGHFVAEYVAGAVADNVRYLDVFVGAGCSSREAVAKLSATPPFIGGSVVQSITEAPGSTTGILYRTPPTPAALVFGGCSVYLNVLALGLAGTVSTDANGAWSVTVGVPNDPSLVGQSFHLQALIVAPGGGPFFGAFELSNGIAITVN